MIPTKIYSDPVHRHKLAAEKLIDHERRVLDVGGYKSREVLLSRYLKDLKYTSANIGSAWYCNESPHVICNGATLPFRDSEFPAVTSVDTLEHMVKEARLGFIRELIRVARDKVVIVTPFSDDRMTLEETFEKFSDRYNIELKPSFREHLLFGLPSSDELRAYVHRHRFQLTYATPKDLFSHFFIAQLVNNLTLLSDATEEVNKNLQTKMEELLGETSDDISIANAYRAVLTIDL